MFSKKKKKIVNQLYLDIAFLMKLEIGIWYDENQNQRQNQTEKSFRPIGCAKTLCDDNLFQHLGNMFFSKNLNRVFNSKSIIDQTITTRQKLQA